MRLVESSNGHLYADPLAFERLMLLIATLARYPGVGALESKATCKRSSGLQVVKARMQTLACRCGLNLPNCSVHTLRKDLECLKRFQILDRRRYCQGYFLGIGALGQSELQLALDGLATMAAVQQDNKAQQTYQHLSQRLKGAEGEAALFYPVRSHHDRSVVCTDPIDRHTRSRNPDTLSQQLALVESAILQGQAVELRRIETVAASQSNPNRSNQGAVAVWPLQLLYYSGVWHLLYERFDKRYLAIERIDCLRDACKVLSDQPRGLKAQQRSLKAAHKLLERGWGIHLGEPGEQRNERQGKLTLVPVTVRFFGAIAAQVLREDRRHPSQTIKEGPRYNDRVAHVDYSVQLPPRSLPEFSQWIYRYGTQAQILSPPELVEQHRREALGVAARYRQTMPN